VPEDDHADEVCLLLENILALVFTYLRDRRDQRGDDPVRPVHCQEAHDVIGEPINLLEVECDSGCDLDVFMVSDWRKLADLLLAEVEQSGRDPTAQDRTEMLFVSSSTHYPRFFRRLLASESPLSNSGTRCDSVEHRSMHFM
jgi:hypothetical protein